jgi:hypothetical protein
MGGRLGVRTSYIRKVRACEGHPCVLRAAIKLFGKLLCTWREGRLDVFLGNASSKLMLRRISECVMRVQAATRGAQAAAGLRAAQHAQPWVCA